MAERLKLKPCRPYFRIRDRRPLVVLTEPARQALAINPDGGMEVCSLNGVGGVSQPDERLRPTPEQASTLAEWAEVLSEWVADD